MRTEPVDEDEQEPQDDEQFAERLLMDFRKSGQPASRADWKYVLAHMITYPTRVIQEIARKGRIMGVLWIVPVAEGILEELNAGRAVRTEDGAITLVAPPKAAGLKVLSE